MYVPLAAFLQGFTDLVWDVGLLLPRPTEAIVICHVGAVLLLPPADCIKCGVEHRQFALYLEGFLELSLLTP
jgi:hypothetical protein